MKIITWNVNGIRSITQKGFYDFVERENPDLLCLQETKAHPDQLEDALSMPLGWKTFWSAAQRAGYSGTSTWCKETPEQGSYGFGIPKFDAEGRLVVTKFPQFTLFNCYFPNGGSGQDRHDYKQEFLRRFGQHLIKLDKSGENVILVGDYNVAYMDTDVYDPKGMAKESGFLPEEREWMVQFLEA